MLMRPASPAWLAPVNHGPWAEDGAHPRRHPWLTAVGTKDDRLVYASAPTPQALRVADPRMVQVGATSSRLCDSYADDPRCDLTCDL
jgi:hypothetical protein